ncbi:MAG: DNA-directed RNA polymerase subunit beta, partial [bacterium]|nr:DNA-directed RNA polymerase subunit beta [bacterium]
MSSKKTTKSDALVVTLPTAGTARPRRFFTQNHDRLAVPDLIQAQIDSYRWFMTEGLGELFQEISPIADFTNRDLELTFEDFFLDEPKFDETTARERNVTFEAALRVRVTLTNKRTGEIKKQEVFFGDFPLMTDRGTFIVNGIERVIVSQIVRSPGVFFTQEGTRGGRQLYGAKIIPNRGAWLEFETDSHGVISVRIDRKRKIAATSLLRAFGLGTDEELKAAFGYTDVLPEILAETIKRDPTKNMADGLREVYKRIRPGDLATADNAKSLIFAMFFNFSRYDLGRVGRHKMNSRFQKSSAINRETRVLQKEDIIETIKEICRLTETQDEPDDIDHLSNRRIRAVGELVQNKLRVGFARLERNVKDRMSTSDMATVTPSQLINSRPVMGVIKEFFMSSQLSQFMDQTNPLAELEHKRRISAMGPGGMSRERAGFDVRDVHRTHYGRICPITTPEGGNIGLVGHLASYAILNPFGFIETPYGKVLKTIPASDASKYVGEIIRGEVRDEAGSVIASDGDVITEALAGKLAKAGIETVSVRPRVTDEVSFMDASAEERLT